MNPTHNPPTTADVAEVAEPTPAHILRAAALYLARHGWTQGDMYTDPEHGLPAACAYGAIHMAVCGTPSVDHTPEQARQVSRAVAALAGHLDTQLYLWGSNQRGEDATATDVVWDWNDQPDRAAQQVIAALSDAADQWDRTHTPTAGGAR